jgi:hypothetical protein
VPRVLRLRGETDLTDETLGRDTGFFEIVSAPTNNRLVITNPTRKTKAKSNGKNAA